MISTSVRVQGKCNHPRSWWKERVRTLESDVCSNPNILLLANYVTLRKSPAYSLSLNTKKTYLSLVTQMVNDLPALLET